MTLCAMRRFIFPPSPRVASELIDYLYGGQGEKILTQQNISIAFEYTENRHGDTAISLGASDLAMSW